MADGVREQAENPVAGYFSNRDSCPGCGAQDAKRLISAPYSEPDVRAHLDRYYGGRVDHAFLSGGSYCLAECRQCGLVYQKEVPNEDLMPRLYEEWVNPPGGQDRYRTSTSPSLYEGLFLEWINVLRHLKVNPAELSVLDYGMGWGNWCHIASAFNSRVYGCELSRSKIENAQAAGVEVLDWEDIPHHQFDFINAEQVFEHLADPLQTVRHLQRGLKPNGLLKISVPSGEYINQAIDQWDWQVNRFAHPVSRALDSLMPVAPLQHINCFKRRSLEAMANAAGLKPVDVPRNVELTRAVEPSFLRDLKKLIRSGMQLVNVRPTPASTTGNLRMYFQAAAPND